MGLAQQHFALLALTVLTVLLLLLLEGQRVEGR
jgi:hypothetical protein